jgi:hypothetical protein
LQDGVYYHLAGAEPQITEAAQRAGPFAPVDLRQEEINGGHAIRKHVELSNSVLISRVESGDIYSDIGDQYNAKPEGYFNSVDDANRYINSVIQSNGDKSLTRNVSECDQVLASLRVMS